MRRYFNQNTGSCLLILKVCIATVSMVVLVMGMPQDKVTTFSLDDVGCLVERNNSGISGKVHVVKHSNQLWISQFNFKKELKDAFFNIGTMLVLIYIYI